MATTTRHGLGNLELYDFGECAAERAPPRSTIAGRSIAVNQSAATVPPADQLPHHQSQEGGIKVGLALTKQSIPHTKLFVLAASSPATPISIMSVTDSNRTT